MKSKISFNQYQRNLLFFKLIHIILQVCQKNYIKAINLIAIEITRYFIANDLIRFKVQLIHIHDNYFLI